MKITECLIFILMVVGILFLVLIQLRYKVPNHEYKTREGGSMSGLFIRFGGTTIAIEVPPMGTARDVLIELGGWIEDSDYHIIDFSGSIHS